MTIESFRKNEDEIWNYQIYSQGEEVNFVSVNFSCLISEIYQKVPGIQKRE